MADKPTLQEIERAGVWQASVLHLRKRVEELEAQIAADRERRKPRIHERPSFSIDPTEHGEDPLDQPMRDIEQARREGAEEFQERLANHVQHGTIYRTEVADLIRRVPLEAPPAPVELTEEEREERKLRLKKRAQQLVDDLLK